MVGLWEILKQEPVNVSIHVCAVIPFFFLKKNFMYIISAYTIKIILYGSHLFLHSNTHALTNKFSLQKKNYQSCYFSALCELIKSINYFYTPVKPTIIVLFEKWGHTINLKVLN